jgi:AraC-like DNA-binding protein
MPWSSHAGRTTHTLQARAIVRLLSVAVAAGLKRDELMEATGLKDVDLTAPDSRVPLSTEVALWQVIATSITDPGFGIRAGGSINLRDTGLLGYLVASSATLGAALHRLARYSRVLSEAVEFRLEALERPFAAIAEVHAALGAALPFAVDFRLASALSACRQITGVDLVPLEVAVTYPRPASTLEHRRFFRCAIRFGQPVSRIVLLERDLSLPIPRGDETLAGYLSEYAEQVLRSLVGGTSMRERVRAAIWSGLADNRSQLSHVAAALRMPPRTLQRRLAAEGTTLHDEVDDIRKAMATAVLLTRSVPVEDVAYLLGYAEPSTFFRAFKRWTGTTPDQFRRDAGERAHGRALASNAT